MFCGKCGNEVSDDALFCSKCGNSLKKQTETTELEHQEVKYKGVKSKKWRFILPVAAVSVFIVVFVLIVSMLIRPSQKKILEAYKDFYKDFYNENVGIEGFNDVLDEDGEVVISAKEVIDVDCCGRIIMAPDGSMMLSIMDYTYVDANGRNSMGDVYLFSYERGKVAEKSAIHNIMIDDIAAFFMINDELYFIYDTMDELLIENPKLESVFALQVFKYNTKNGELEKVDWEIMEDAKDIDFDKLYEEGNYDWLEYKYETEDGIPFEEIWMRTTCGYVYSGYQILSSVAIINGRNFDNVIEEMLEMKIKDSEELQIFWNKKILEIVKRQKPNSEFSEHMITLVTVTDDAYYGVDLNEKAVLLGIKDKEISDVSNLLKRAGNYEVIGINMDCFYDCKNVATVKIPDNITYIDGRFNRCESLSELEIPDSVVEITYTSMPESILVFCGKGSTAEKYAVENGWFYVNGTIDSADESEVSRVKQEMKWNALEN